MLRTVDYDLQRFDLRVFGKPRMPQTMCRRRSRQWIEIEHRKKEVGKLHGGRLVPLVLLNQNVDEVPRLQFCNMTQFTYRFTFKLQCQLASSNYPIIIIIIKHVLIKVTLSCQKHYRGTAQSLTSKKNRQKG